MKHFSLIAALLFSSQLQAQETDWAAINLAVTDSHVLPAYQRFADASTGLAAAAEEFCTAPSDTTLAGLRQKYGESMDGWQGIQHIQFGPVTYFNWNYRLQYWPDDKGTGARQLDALIASQDATKLETNTFARQSVGVQGFPALERLLSGEQAGTELQQDAYRCQVLQAISANIESIAAQLNERWRDEFRDTVVHAEQHDYYENAEDATIDYYKSLAETIRKYQQQKLESVLGEAGSRPRSRRAESWRSARSLRNLRLNYAALENLFSAGSPALGVALQPEDRTKVQAAFDTVNQHLQQLPDSYEQALSMADGEAGLRLLRDEVDALFETLETSLKNTDLYLGFNSLDGD